MTIAHETSHGQKAIRLANSRGEAVIHLHGAHVVHFQPTGEQPVLWMSGSSWFQDGKPIRGGVPVCAPWFGPHPTDAQLPAHGLVRQRPWALTHHEELVDGRTRVQLSLAADEAMLAAWPHPFSATLTVTVGATLEIELAVRNTGNAPFLLGEALHTYFAISDVRKIRISGLTGALYLDKMDNSARKQQGPEPIAITAQTDRVYFSEESSAVIDDPGFGRRIVVRKGGSGATVVWNPWIEKAKALADFGDDEWPGMVCVEAVNAADSTVVVPPSFTHHLRQTIAVEH